jgi:glycosyltransferase involved in cell wall biosynthesis
MKFLFFSAQYLPTIGGIERFNYDLGRALVGEGHQVTIITSELPDQPTHEFDQGLEIVRLPSLPLMGGRYPVPRFNRKFRALTQEIFSSPVDFALIHTRFWALSLWAARACRRRGIPSSILEHGSDYLSLGNPLANTASHLYEHFATRWMSHYSGLFSAVSTEAGQWLSTFGINEFDIISHAINIEETQRQAELGSWDVRADCGLDSSAKLVVFLGRLIPDKGLRELAHAFAIVKQQIPEAHLLIAGDGPLESELRTNQQDGVILLGGLPHQQALSLLGQADVFCLPSYCEGFSAVVLEAVGMGAALVTTTTVPAAVALVSSPEIGTLVPDTHPDTLATALVHALTDDTWREKASRLASQRLEQLLTWDNTVRQLVTIATDRRAEVK